MKIRMTGLTAAFLLTAGAAQAAECIAPANPGGGWDFTCRQIGKILYDINQVDSPVQVTSMAGGGGGLAFASVVANTSALMAARMLSRKPWAASLPA